MHIIQNELSEVLRTIKDVTTQNTTHETLLLTELEVQSLKCELSFFFFDLWSKHEVHRRTKEAGITNLPLFCVSDGFGDDFSSRGTPSNFYRTSKAKRVSLTEIVVLGT